MMVEVDALIQLTPACRDLICAVGNYCVRNQADISPALEALKDRPLYAEQWVNFRMVSENTKFFRTFLILKA